jgi:hypothetical protein
MNVDIEFTVKIRAKDDDNGAQKPSVAPILTRVADKLLAHPCVLLILRQFVER